jgi:hypothetical protein
VVPYFLLTFEFITACGFVLVFYYLFIELKKILSIQKYQKIKYRTATYLSLISILASSRFFYYGVIELTYNLADGVQRRMPCSDLVPTYLTEIFFCLFVLFHIFVEGRTKQDEPALTGHKTDFIPVYIVKDNF